jgi:hypothetical protein
MSCPTDLIASVTTGSSPMPTGPTTLHWPAGSSPYPTQPRRAGRAFTPKMVATTKTGMLRAVTGRRPKTLNDSRHSDDRDRTCGQSHHRSIEDISLSVMNSHSISICWISRPRRLPAGRLVLLGVVRLPEDFGLRAELLFTPSPCAPPSIDRGAGARIT